MPSRGFRALSCFVLMTALVAAQTYCIPQATGFTCSVGDEYIQNVSFLSINNSSACGVPPGYEDYTASVAQAYATPGQTFAISVTVGQFWNTDQVYIFIDLNGDGIFQTADLLTTLTSNASGSGTSTQLLAGTVTIPACLPVTNLTTRLRARLTYGPATAGSEACGSDFFGNCEDYSLFLGGTNIPPQYQVNQAGSNFDIGGDQGTICTPSNVVRCTNQPFHVNLSSIAIGYPWDVAASAAAPVSGWAGTIHTMGGQIVNLDLTTAFLVFGSAAPPFTPLTLTFSIGVPASLSLQMVNRDPSNIDGFSLSQPVGLSIVTGATYPILGPVGDDSEVVVANPCVTFFGQTQTQMSISSNGRLGFGTGLWTSNAPTAAALLADGPSVGVWCDLDPSLGGNITATSPASNLVRVAYVNVPYLGQANVVNNFYIELDSLTGSVTIGGLGGIALGSQTQIIGISAGSVGATDPGATLFFVGPNTGPSGLGMIYGLGTEGSITSGLTALIFTPNQGGNYDWAGI